LADTGSTSTEQGTHPSVPATPKWAWVEVERGGRVALPAAVLEALGMQEGDQVQLALEGGSIRILTRSKALQELRARVQQFVPEGVSLVDELIAERRAEAVKDTTDG
jgi:antitoxin component of MazEF toxin-antitoxin module